MAQVATVFQIVAFGAQVGDFPAVEKKEWHGTPNTGRERRNWTAILPFDEARLQTLSGARCYQYAKGSKAEGLRAVYRDAEGRPLCVVQRFVDEEGGKSDLPFVWAQSDDGVQAWAIDFKSAESPPSLKNTTKKFSFILANTTFLLYYTSTV